MFGGGSREREHDRSNWEEERSQGKRSARPCNGLSNGWGSGGPVDEKRPGHHEEDSTAYLVDERYFYLTDAQDSVEYEESRYGGTQHCDQYILESGPYVNSHAFLHLPPHKPGRR